MHETEYGTIIREARQKLGLTQQELAKSLSMSRTTVSQIETGRIREIGFFKMERLCYRLGLDIVIQPARKLPTLQEAFARNQAQRAAAFAQTDAMIARMAHDGT